jgi:hypothetical protein
MSPLHSPTRRPTATAWLARALLGVVLAAALPSPALAGELRQITLVDGRVIVGEVLATEADGLRMAVPQGELKLPLALLADMQNSDQRALAESEPWQIRVLPGPRAQAIAAAMASIDAVVVSTPPTPDGCAATDLACAVAALPGGWVVVHDEDALGLVLRSGYGPTRHEARPGGTNPLESSVYSLLELRPPPVTVVRPPPEAPPPPPPPEPVFAEALPPSVPPASWDQARVARTALVPVPGLASFKQKDALGGAAAVVASVAGSAAWVYATGRTSTSAAQQAALGAVGCYAITVAASSAAGARSLRGTSGVTIAPVVGPDGTAGVVVSGHR